MLMAPNEAVVDLFFALGDRTRLSVVRKLGGGAALSATTLCDGAEVTRQAIVKHLQVLEGAGLVTHERRGREVLYALETRRLTDAQDFLEAVSESWDRAIDRLRGIVEEHPPSLTHNRLRPRAGGGAKLPIRRRNSNRQR
jgi:DNA-binding transcriptional ArsR family regulator